MNRSKEILRQTAALERLLEENFDATGADLGEKASAAASELPKGILDKLAFLANLQRAARRGDAISKADCKQAGYWTNAARPYLDYGAARGRGRGRRVVAALAILAVLAFLAAKFGGFFGAN